MKNSTSAGAIRFSAVPPMVWSARRLIEAKLRSSEIITNSELRKAIAAYSGKENPDQEG